MHKWSLTCSVSLRLRNATEIMEKIVVLVVILTQQICQIKCDELQERLSIQGKPITQTNIHSLHLHLFLPHPVFLFPSLFLQKSQRPIIIGH